MQSIILRLVDISLNLLLNMTCLCYYSIRPHIHMSLFTFSLNIFGDYKFLVILLPRGSYEYEFVGSPLRRRLS